MWRNFLALDPDIGQEMVYEYMNSEGYLSDVLNTVLGKMDENISVTSTETRLTLRRAGGKWKITGEN